ncbi:Ribulose bisphosphate carboxylase [Durusdinium trenchii]|uniref:Ribulose bisphosphate carboxylase n=1 Tax=Durusdinium trenchii TaxID=1381693 RepID=A0ABP0PLE7_9DINO
MYIVSFIGRRCGIRRSEQLKYSKSRFAAPCAACLGFEMQVSRQFYFEVLHRHEVEDPQRMAALKVAQEVELQIQRSLKELPLTALTDPCDEVRIPALAFMKSGEDYVPLRFEIESGASSWAKIGLEDGVLTTTAAPPSRLEPIRIDLYNSEGLAAVVDCSVTSSRQPEPVWQKGTVSLVARFTDVQKCPLSRNSRIVLQEHLSKIYDFDTSTPKETTFGRWLSCMTLILRLLRSLTFGNLVKSEAQLSRPPPRAAVALSH